MIDRKELMDILQITKPTWIKHEVEGGFENKAEYTDSEALEIIKYFRYASKVKTKSSTDYNMSRLAKLCCVQDRTIKNYWAKGLIPTPDKTIGLRRYWTYDTAMSIKASTKFGMTPHQKAKLQGFYHVSDTAKMLGMPRISL